MVHSTNQVQEISNQVPMLTASLSAPSNRAIKQIFSQFKKDNETLSSVDVNQTVLKLAVENLYSLPQNKELTATSSNNEKPQFFDL
ncbi:hypothetical protein EB796_011036 [Bugula neritina]|uniref:Uncharacterized protein n=1 Tax=Bugula neritina TaxID=10212 RepID=A0A7J7JW34_BUGNE|nr:hypothetical protein EB796_011036 [Bugula neritina]